MQQPRQLGCMVNKTFVRKMFMIGAQATGLTLVSRALLGGMGGVLMLHRVSPPINGSGINNFLCVTPQFVDQLLHSLKGDGFIFVSLDECVDRLKGGHSDQRFLSVTLDDGYRDNMIAAAPVFRAHEIPFTIYVCPGFVEGTAHLWWDILANIISKQDRIAFNAKDGRVVLTCKTRIQKHAVYSQIIDHVTRDLDEETQRRFVCDLGDAYAVDCVQYTRDAILPWSDLRELSKDPLCTIGAHTLNHYHLARLPEEQARTEIEESGQVIGAELGKVPEHFAYPYGGPIAVGKREVRIAKEAGYTTAVTTRHGLLRANHGNHLHAIPRVSLNGNYQRSHYVRTMLSGITVPASNFGRLTVTV
ncbi:MAG: polysaccharide deacetylase family protein [Pseudomonadota bacterium]